MKFKLPILKNTVASLINWASELRRSDFVVFEEERWEDCDIAITYPTGRTGVNVEESKVKRSRTSHDMEFKCKFWFETPGPGAIGYVDVQLPFTPAKINSHVALAAIADITAGTDLAGFGIMSVAEDGDTLRIRYCDGTTFAAAHVFCIRIRGGFELN